MKQVTIKFVFDISEEDFKKEEFQEFKNSIFSGEMQRDINKNESRMGAKNTKISLEIK
jgi:hypothetical protein